MKDNINKAST